MTPCTAASSSGRQVDRAARHVDSCLERVPMDGAYQEVGMGVFNTIQIIPPCSRARQC